MIKKVIITSKDPVKVNAVKIWFKKMFPWKKFLFENILVSSEINEQPINDKKTLFCATSKINKAKKQFRFADYWVSLECWIEIINDEMQVFGRIVVKSKKIASKSKTGTFFLHKKIIELIDIGEELWDVNNTIFGQSNLKGSSGVVWILTWDVINRTNFFSSAIILALIPFRNSWIY